MGAGIKGRSFLEAIAHSSNEDIFNFEGCQAQRRASRVFVERTTP